MKQYVQHESGKGEKWEVDEVRTLSGGSVVCVKPKVHGNAHPLLPKSEYIPCDPPEEWEDVTNRCRVGDSVSMPADGRGSILFQQPDGCVWADVFHPCQSKEYRLRKIDGPHNGPCFIVERLKS